MPDEIGASTEGFPRCGDVMLAIRAGEAHDGDPLAHDSSQRIRVSSAAPSWVVLKPEGPASSRIDACSMTGLARKRSHIEVTRVGRSVLVGGLDDEADDLADVHALDRPRTRARAGLARSSGPRGSAIPSSPVISTTAANLTRVAPYQSAKREPGDLLVGGDIARPVWRPRPRRASAAARDSLSQPVLSAQSRTGCLSNDGGVVPGAHEFAAQNRDESGVRISSQMASSPSMKPSSNFVSAIDDAVLERPRRPALVGGEADLPRLVRRVSAPTRSAASSKEMLTSWPSARLGRGREHRLGEALGLEESRSAAPCRASCPLVRYSFQAEPAR